MKAVVITKEGFMKYIDVYEKTPYLRSLAHIRANINPMKTKLDDIVPVFEYEFVRSYINEFDEEILIYKETQ